MKVINCAQGTLEWQKERLAKITGTRLKDVMGTAAAQKKLISCLIAEEGTEQMKISRPTAEMERGTAEEIFAIRAFSEKFNKKVERVGICISDEFPWLAHSPDGLIKVKGKYREAIEVKNPDSATMISYRLGEGISDIGVPEEYKWQVVDAFLVNGDLRRLHFMVHDARFVHDDHKIYMVTVERTMSELARALAEAQLRLGEFRSRWVECRDRVLPSNF